MSISSLAPNDRVEALRSGVVEGSLKALIPSLTQGTITLLFTDIVGSTSLAALSREAEQNYFLDTKPRHDSLLKSEIEKAGGHILNLIGDSFFAGFQSATSAVRSARAVQDALARDAIQTPCGPLRIRIGLHTGEPTVYHNVLGRYDLCGTDVNKAARIEAAAGAGQIFLSAQTKALVEGMEGFSFHSHGRCELAGLGRSEVFELLWDGRIPKRPKAATHAVQPDLESAFVGRSSELGQLRKALDTHRLVTITGSGGIGKTRVAKQIALLLDLEAWAAREVCLVSFDQVTRDSDTALLEAFVASLGIDLASYGDAMTALVAEFRQRPTLLVLDNCDTAPRSIGRVVRQILDVCINLQILATSQRPVGLPGVEAVFPLDPMSHPGVGDASLATLKGMDSFQLFLAAAQRADSGWNVTEERAKPLATILGLTDGIPLAIELVAAAVPFRSLEELAAELAATPLGDITDVEATGGSVSHGTTERHRSLLRCYQWSFDHLTVAEQQCFVGLSAFVGTFTEAAARHVCEVENVRSLITRLIQAGLIQRRPDINPSRYSMLRITRAFARLKAREAGREDALYARHLDFFVLLATGPTESASDQPRAWDHDWPDLVAAAYEAERLQFGRAVWQISWSLGPFLMHRGLWVERERLNRAAVVAAKQANAWGPLERSLIDLGIVLEAEGNWSVAAGIFQEALFFADRNAHPSVYRQSLALHRLARVLEKMGRVKDAQRYLDRLERITPQLDSLKARARSLDNEGHALQSRGDWLQAALKFEESLRLRESCNDENGIAHSRDNLGVNLTLRGEWSTAEIELQHALQVCRDLEADRHQSIVLSHLGDLFRRQRRYEEAVRHLEASLRLRKDDPKGEAVTLVMLGRVLRSQRLWTDAEKSLRKSLELAESIGDTEGAALAYDELGTTFSLQHRWDEAIAALEQGCARKRGSKFHDDGGVAISLDRLAQVHVRQGSLEKAKAMFTESAELSKRVGRWHQAAVTAMNLGLAFAAEGSKEMALRHLDGAIAYAQHGQRDVLKTATKLRARLARRMRSGVPWRQWADAIFEDEQVGIRRRFEKLRQEEKWATLVAAYEGLVQEFTEAGLTRETGMALNELGSAYRREGKYLESEAAIRKALTLFDEIGLSAGKAHSWHKLGDLHADRREWDQAERAFGESLRLKREMMDDEGEVITLDGLAKVFVAQGRLDRAQEISARSWSIIKQFGTATQKWYPLEQLISLKLECDDLQGAIELARVGVAELSEHGAMATRARALLDRLLRRQQVGASPESGE